MIGTDWRLATGDSGLERSDRDGQGLVEYGLIIVLVAVAVITLLAALGSQVATVYQRILTSIA